MASPAPTLDAMTFLTDGRRTMLPFRMHEHAIVVGLVITTRRA